MHQYNFVSPHQPMLTSPQVVSETVWSQPDVQEIPCPPTASKKGKDKKVSRRDSNFTTEEDEVICSAWLNVTTDAAIGCNQTEGGFYKRIHTYFKQNKPQGSEHNQIAIQGRLPIWIDTIS
ncbi:uncharacterized protein LOC120695024 [Panicum virgatum]|uniref:uncharacterized protein LOC120695024 n=1 Tax=Panicum virgatum TaxID=38727 RepID=UPI0019D67BC2|nr:uncharacterized protein LOC120695024 [Panicum virgatum]